ncbi:hypothetical protein K501DRAFT_299148 [Backusella circina FSU 941]|nr:hypothetical protein K501DRAFT_299148 [Backusella circina FSU 941]
MHFFKSQATSSHPFESNTGSQQNIDGDQFDLDNILICATNGKIYSIHKKNGKCLWRKNFSGAFSSGIISLFVTDCDKIIAGANGKTLCIDMMTGNTVWVNKMKGFGSDNVSVVSTPSLSLLPRRYPVTSSSRNNEKLPKYEDHNFNEKPIVICTSRGKIIAINIETGIEIWRYNCTGSLDNMPLIVIDPPNVKSGRPDQRVYVGAGQWLYCLKAYTGDLLWASRVSSSKFGTSYMTLATPWSSRLAAEAYSGFNQNPAIHQLDNIQQQEVYDIN